MKSARKSLFRQIIIRFSILTFVLLIIISGIWLFFFRDLLLHAGVPDAKVASSLFLVGRFVIILIIVIIVIFILLGLIFINGFKTSLFELLKQITGLKDAPFGSRVNAYSNNELDDLTSNVNLVIEKLENEIKNDLTTAANEHLHLVEEQSRTGFEQKKIYEEKQKLEYVLSRIKDGVILLTRNRNIVLLNKAAEELLGYKQYEAGGKMISRLIKFYDDDNREIMPDEYAPAARLGEMKEESFLKKHIRVESEQATAKYIDLICLKLTLIQTQDLGYLIVMHDLSARLEIEKKRTDLLSSFARELKQPLDNSDGSTQQAHISVLLENLMTAVDIESNAVTIARDPVDLAILTGNAITALQGLAGARQVSMQLSVPENFSAIVNGDQLRLNQVILNLLLNAINFTPPGGSINLALSQAENEIVLEIQDTGIGIPTEAIKDLFTKFFTVPNEKGIATGIGLGLYISKKLIELHEGKIWLDSVEGRGTIASISLTKTT